MNKVGCIIPSAGWGSICPIRSQPKVLARIGDKPMLKQVIDTVASAGATGSTVVVVGDNPYGELVRQELAGYSNTVFAAQPSRRGAADAVAHGLPYLYRDESHVLVTFADMPLWRPETIRTLVSTHLEQNATVSMVTLKLLPGHKTERYGRIARDEYGRIIAAFDPWELAGRPLNATTVNPSLYVFNRAWLTENIPHIPPADKGDGFEPELYVPKLLPLAHDQGRKIAEVELLDPNEALGVNTAEEFDEVLRVWHSRTANTCFV